KERELVCKIRRAVKRIDDPFACPRFRRSGRSRRTRLFGQNRVMRITLANAADDESLGFLVRCRDKVRAPLQLNVFLATHVVLQDVTGISSQFYGEVEIFHYLFGVLEALKAAMRSSNLRKPSSAARDLKAGSVLILSNSLNPSSKARFR